MNRNCGSCHACCDGWLEGYAYGVAFGNKKKCSFLCAEKCVIYQIRPQVCKNYYCAWVQGLFSESLKPDESGLLVSVNDWSQGQFFRIIETNDANKEKHLQEIYDFCEQNKTPYIFKSFYYTKSIIVGPEEFIKERQSIEDCSLYNLQKRN